MAASGNRRTNQQPNTGRAYAEIWVGYGRMVASRSLNLRVDGSIPSWLTSFNHR
jgi:hypothetical protein